MWELFAGAEEKGRVTEISEAEQRISAIAKSYAAHPENTIIVSPDNASRRALNQEVRRELKEVGLLEKEDRSIRVLAPRSDMTGADRAWAARYEPGDVLHYIANRDSSRFRVSSSACLARARALALRSCRKAAAISSHHATTSPSGGSSAKDAARKQSSSSRES